MLIRITVIWLTLFGSSYSSTNTLSFEVERSQNAIIIDVNLANEDTLSGMQIPLDLSMSLLGYGVDSVYFAGFRCEQFFELFYKVYAEEDKLFLYMIESADATLESSPLLPGSGTIARIYLSRVGAPQINLWRIRNDLINDEKRDLRYLFWTNHAVEVPCTFSPADIDISQ